MIRNTAFGALRLIGAHSPVYVHGALARLVQVAVVLLLVVIEWSSSGDVAAVAVDDDVVEATLHPSSSICIKL